MVPNTRHKAIRFGAREDTRVTRMMLGKPRFALQRNATCETCDESMTVEHVLLKCEKYRAERGPLLAAISSAGMEATSKNALNPLKDTRVFRAARRFLNGIDAEI